MKSAFAALALVLLAGCAANSDQTQSNQTQAGRMADENRKLLADANATGNACAAALARTEEGKVVSDQILFGGATSQNKFELMSSKAKLNQIQKEALRTYLKGVPECRQPLSSAWARVDPAFAGASARYYSKMDAIYLALLDGKFTIGDANRAKDKAGQEQTTELSAADAQYMQKLQAMENDEYARRQRAAAIMLPYLMQQNAINAQNQQNLYNQQMRNIRNNTPVYVQPVNTTCQAVGNQINCISR
jgi:hypothetical protein